MTLATVLFGWLAFAGSAVAITWNPDQPPYLNRWFVGGMVSAIYFVCVGASLA